MPNKEVQKHSFYFSQSKLLSWASPLALAKGFLAANQEVVQQSTANVPRAGEKSAASSEYLSQDLVSFRPRPVLLT